MKDLNTLFRKRIGFPEGKKLSFENLSEVLEKTARTIPFENLCIMKNNNSPITKENLIEKILVGEEGGLCYEINPTVYLFLQEDGFNVSLVSGVVYNQTTKDWSATGRTHVAIILEHAGKRFLLDSGFGSNLPLVPVPLDGKEVSSSNGEFRIKQTVHEFGDFLLEMKRKDKDEDWVVGYIFDSGSTVEQLSDLGMMQKTIIESEHSSFNKGPLITKITEKGNMTLTATSFTVWNEGKMTKEEIDEERFIELSEQHFGVRY